VKIKNILFLIATISLAACLTPTFGLKPIYPKNECSEERLDFTDVDSLQPVLRWETFPPEGIRSDAEQINNIRDITYDLNMWLSENDSPSYQIYSKRGLTKPQYEMEEPLLPCTRYFWTVRARFLVDGKERVSEWGISARPWFWRDPSKFYGTIKVADGDEIVRRSPVVPHPNLYRFGTPCPERAEGTRTFGIP
jgi:hypothetical protein